MTGGQFNKFFSGTFYERDGAFVAPSRFDVTYHRNYAAAHQLGLGPVTDLKPLTGTVDPDIKHATAIGLCTRPDVCECRSERHVC